MTAQLRKPYVYGKVQTRGRDQGSAFDLFYTLFLSLPSFLIVCFQWIVLKYSSDPGVNVPNQPFFPLTTFLVGLRTISVSQCQNFIKLGFTKLVQMKI